MKNKSRNLGEKRENRGKLGWNLALGDAQQPYKSQTRDTLLGKRENRKKITKKPGPVFGCSRLRRDLTDIFDWFIDSGASESFTDQRQIIENFQPITTGSWTMSGIGGMSLEVHGRGDLHIIAEIYPLITRILV